MGWLIPYLGPGKGWMALCVVAYLYLAGTAHAASPALGWSRLPGAEGCISPLQLARLVEARIGHPVLEAPSRAGVAIEGYVTPLEGPGEQGFLAVVVVHDALRGEVGRRELRSGSPDCRALDLPLSLVVALAVDSDAALPMLIDNGGLSEEAVRLLDQLELPSSDPDAALALLAPPKPGSAGAARSSSAQRLGDGQGTAAPPRMVLVRADELRRLRTVERAARKHGISATGEAPGAPDWPGYVMLVAAGTLTAAGLYATSQVAAMGDDAILKRYAEFADARRPGQGVDACAEAAAGYHHGTPYVDYVNNLCDYAEAMNIAQWLMYGAALASAATGGAWLLWVSDDAPAVDRQRASTLQLVPDLGPQRAGAALRLQF